MSLQTGRSTEKSVPRRDIFTEYMERSCKRAWVPASGDTLEHRGKDAGGHMPMRPKLEILLHLEPDAAFFKHIARASQREWGIAQEILDNSSVFLVENAAGSIDEPPARLHQPCGPGENRFLLFHELGDILRRLAPFHVGIAPQRPEAAARRVPQHAVDLARQTLHARVVHAFDPLRVHVREPRARESGLQPGEPLRGDIERVQAPRRAHKRSEGERLAARACAEIHHHLTALGRDQMAEQLAAFVLDLDAAVKKQRVPVDRRLLLDPDPFGRVRRRGGAKSVGQEAFERRFARDLQRIHAQVEWRVLQQPLRQSEQRRFVVAGAQAPDRPIGKLALDLEGLRRGRLALDRGEPLGFVAAQPRVELAQIGPEERGPGRESKTPRTLGRRDALEKPSAPERRVHRIGDRGAVALANFRMAAKKRREHRIGGLFERQHGRKGRRARIEERAREARHLPMRVRIWSERVPSVSTTRTRTGRKSRSAANQMSVDLSSGPSRNFAMCSVCISPAGVASFSIPTTVKRNGVNPRPSARITSYSLPLGGTNAKLYARLKGSCAVADILSVSAFPLRSCVTERASQSNLADTIQPPGRSSRNSSGRSPCGVMWPRLVRFKTPNNARIPLPLPSDVIA